MVWKDECKAWIELDRVKAPIASGKVVGNTITLQLSASADAKTIGYISGRAWDGRADKLLLGANGLAALTFCEVPIAASKAAR